MATAAIGDVIRVLRAVCSQSGTIPATMAAIRGSGGVTEDDRCVMPYRIRSQIKSVV
jgi:hypothetical protein